ncbi:MAG: 30S ribosomal protein S17 [Candidatus Omnitrophota bacterium]|nr:MAG: 30S ribosomal protein S17 [Candidatus Omnitrophota bacterium]
MSQLKHRVGIVISNKMDKTCIVHVPRLTKHPLYKKTIRKFVNFKVHDEQNAVKKGDKVEIVEIRPLSKDKRWMLVRIIESKKE